MSLPEGLSSGLREILAAGRIADDEINLLRLWHGDNSPVELIRPDGAVRSARMISGLYGLKRRFGLMRVEKERRSRDQLADECRRVQEAAATAAEILDLDLHRNCELEILLGVYGVDTVKTAEALHCLRKAAAQAFAVLRTDEHLRKLFPDAEIEVWRTPRQHRAETDETWLFFELYKLYCSISKKTKLGNDKGGPLYRFVKACAPLIWDKIEIPDPPAFRACLRAAIKRRKDKTVEIPVSI
jgi:hypothetical protein